MKITRRDAVKLLAGSVPAYYAGGRLVIGAENAPADSEQPKEESKPLASLKDVYKGKFLIGTAGDLPRGYNETELENIKKHYDIVTPENCMKPQGTQPSEGNFNFQQPDALADWCKENGLKVWGHTLCWHSQTPQFFFQGTREDGLARLQKHIETVAGHMAGKVIGWDVVNESINDGGNSQTENLRNSSWYRLVGPDVLNKAFEWAHKTDPDAKLYYNDYNIEQDAAYDRGKHPSSLILLKRLLDEGAPIDGVGVQGHWHLDTKIENIEKAIENYKELGLEVAFTEIDVTATGTNSGAFNPGGAGGGGGARRGGAGGAGGAGTRRGRGGATPPEAPAPEEGAMLQSRNSTFSLAGFGGGAPGAGAPGGAPGGAGGGMGGFGGGGMGGFGGGGMGGFGGGRGGGGGSVSPEVLEQQAQIYAKIFKIFLDNADVVTRATFWGISDTRSWRRGQNPLLFDGQMNAKPCFHSIVEVGLGTYKEPEAKADAGAE